MTAELFPLGLWDRHSRLTLQERYEAWLATPDGQTVARSVLEKALDLRARGWRHYGIAALFEAARYDYDLRVGPDADGWKLNNDYRSRLARDLMDENPSLVGFFETRTLTA